MYSGWCGFDRDLHYFGYHIKGLPLLGLGECYACETSVGRTLVLLYI